MRFNKKCAAAILGLGALLAGSRASMASLTLTDISQDTATGTFVYAMHFDDTDNLQANDGFVLYDFPGVMSATITGDIIGGLFNGTLPLTSNTLNQPADVDSAASIFAAANSIAFDDPTKSNFNVSYIGSPAQFFGPVDAVLTVLTSVHGGTAQSVYGSTIHGGATSFVAGGAPPTTFMSGVITVPTDAVAAVPLPSAWLSGGALLALMGAYRVRKARQIA